MAGAGNGISLGLTSEPTNWTSCFSNAEDWTDDDPEVEDDVNGGGGTSGSRILRIGTFGYLFDKVELKHD